MLINMKENLHCVDGIKNNITTLTHLGQVITLVAALAITVKETCLGD